MGINEFLDLYIGQWFGLRTCYQLTEPKIDNSKSEMTIEKFAPNHPEVIDLCRQSDIDPSLTVGGTKTSWDNSPDWGKPKQTGATLIVWIPETDNPRQGKMLRGADLGDYHLGEDEVLTLTLQTAKIYAQERVWFPSPNLRLRTTLTRQTQGFSHTAFYSEIRRVVSKS